MGFRPRVLVRSNPQAVPSRDERLKANTPELKNLPQNQGGRIT